MASLVTTAWWALRGAWAACSMFLRAVRRLVRGDGTAHDLQSAIGPAGAFRPHWVGPAGNADFTAEYVQQEVRGRGETRQPYDLLVNADGCVALLTRGRLRG